MRTTLALDDSLLRRAKRRALEQNQTLSDVVNEALREILREAPVSATPFSMVTYGHPARLVRHEPADFAAVSDVEDGERPPHAAGQQATNSPEGWLRPGECR